MKDNYNLYRKQETFVDFKKRVYKNEKQTAYITYALLGFVIVDIVQYPFTGSHLFHQIIDYFDNIKNFTSQPYSTGEHVLGLLGDSAISVGGCLTAFLNKIDRESKENLEKIIIEKKQN